MLVWGHSAKKREAPGNQQEESELENVDESLIQKFSYDLDQLACALSVTSNVVSIINVWCYLPGWWKILNLTLLSWMLQVLEKAQHANVEQRDIELVTRELTKHQARLAELKSRMANISQEDGFNRDSGSSFVHDFERKLSCQVREGTFHHYCNGARPHSTPGMLL